MGKTDMRDTDYLFQPRGQGTGWCFRMATPKTLMGRPNPRLSTDDNIVLYKREIREGLGTSSPTEARSKRDILLGQIRAEAMAAEALQAGNMEEALKLAAERKKITDPEVQAAWEDQEITQVAEALEAKRGLTYAKRWHKVATGEAQPFKDVYDKYLREQASKRSTSYRNNLKTAYTEFMAYARGCLGAKTDDEVMMPDMGRYLVGAVRFIPLVGVAWDVVKARLDKHKTGPLFPELTLRKSTGKRGGALSQEFTRVRRRVLGDETDNELDFHAFRHTWRTIAHQAGIQTNDALEMGGWAAEKTNDSPYLHGLRAEQYIQCQKAVLGEFRKLKYLP
jgi:hypothetical protein